MQPGIQRGVSRDGVQAGPVLQAVAPVQTETKGEAMKLTITYMGATITLDRTPAERKECIEDDWTFIASAVRGIREGITGAAKVAVEDVAVHLTGKAGGE